jgi:hypothetical protein
MQGTASKQGSRKQQDSRTPQWLPGALEHPNEFDKHLLKWSRYQYKAPREERAKEAHPPLDSKAGTGPMSGSDCRYS